MKADAPGKLVVSGAYSVLFGAPALVAAVNRRVFAESDKVSDFEAPEVTEGMKLLEKSGTIGQRPWYDAGALRQDTQKLGLGSSAAICVSSLALLLGERLQSQGKQWDTSTTKEVLYPLALEAHRLAQGGGSGVDIAAACFGGVISARRASSPQGPLEIESTRLPKGLTFEVWASEQSASTAQFVKSVFAAEKNEASRFAPLMAAQSEASREAARACEQDDSPGFVSALRSQFTALCGLGQLAQVPIVLASVAKLHKMLDQNACFLPSGAGGGDISLYVGPSASSESFRARAQDLGLSEVELALGAAGLQLDFTS